MSSFDLADGLVYLNGNSLGPLPRGVAERVQEVVSREWGEGLIRSWNDAHWMELIGRVADRIAPLIGVRGQDLHLGDSTSVCLFKTTVAAARLRPDRNVLVVEPSTFPTDGYITAGVAELMGLELRWCDPADPLAAVDDDVALLSLTHVDFRTGAMFDMATITAEAQARGALVQWDLCHSTGAVPGRPHRGGRGPGSGLHLQVPQRRSRLPRVPLGRARAPGRRPAADHRLDGPRGTVRDGARLRRGRGHRQLRVRHPAGARALGAGGSARGVRVGERARAQDPLARADRPVHGPRRGAAPAGSSRSSPRASTSGAAARSRCATPRRTAWSRR